MTKDRAVRVAVQLADRGGIESVSMRHLAEELSVTAMSLYYHVKSKEDILDGMIEVVVGEIMLPSPGAQWKAALRERAESARSVLARHPWAISMVDSRTTRATLRHHDAVAGCLADAGFSIPLAAHAMSVLDSYVHGFALQEASLPTDASGDISEATSTIMDQQQLMAPFPHLARMAVELILQPGYAYGNEFDFGIQLILDGIEAAAAAEPAEAAGAAGLTPDHLGSPL